MKNTRYDTIVEFQVTGDYALFSDPILRVGGEMKCTPSQGHFNSEG